MIQVLDASFPRRFQSLEGLVYCGASQSSHQLQTQAVDSEEKDKGKTKKQKSKKSSQVDATDVLDLSGPDLDKLEETLVQPIGSEDDNSEAEDQLLEEIANELSSNE